jgi:uncharacterized protein (TIGR02679 family)
VTGHRAARRLAEPALGPLLDELVRRYEAGDQPVTVTLRGLSMPQRSALADLLGTDRLPAATCRVQVQHLVRSLGLEHVAELRAAVEELRGPLSDRRAERARVTAARADLWVWFAGEVEQLDPGPMAGRSLAGWVDRVRARGVRGGLEVRRAQLAQALAVLRALPTDGVPLAVLAQGALGDPHGLDPGRAVAALVLEALAEAAGAAPPGDAEGARLLWESVGVAPDPLSSTVLCLGVRAAPSHPLGGLLEISASVSEPVVLTLAQLRRWPLDPLPPESVAHVVENPSLMAAAARRPWTGPPLVCSSGRPTVAVVSLLRQLGAAGAVLAQHADLDPAGLAITAWLADRARTTPWRMRAQDLTAALAVDRPRPPLRGTVGPTTWDPLLGPALAEAGVTVPEEDLVDELLDAMEAGST